MTGGVPTEARAGGTSTASSCRTRARAVKASASSSSTSRATQGTHEKEILPATATLEDRLGCSFLRMTATGRGERERVLQSAKRRGRRTPAGAGDKGTAKASQARPCQRGRDPRRRRKERGHQGGGEGERVGGRRRASMWGEQRATHSSRPDGGGRRREERPRRGSSCQSPSSSHRRLPTG